MRIAFVLTYPIYHDFNRSTEAWLALHNQNRWIPGLLTEMGHEVEYWVVGQTREDHVSALEGFPPYPIRIFPYTSPLPHSKRDYSDALVDYARTYDADLTLLKGVDGGIGVRLIERYLKPEGKPYVMVTGGDYYTRHVPDAALVVYETEEQAEKLMNPGWRRWRRRIPRERLIHQYKSVDTDAFRPMPDVEKRWDVLVSGRLIPYYKDYSALGPLSEVMTVAVAGSGPMEAKLRAQYPRVEWLGQRPNREMPELINAARTYMFTGLRDFYPRVLAEAMACGVPVIAFASIITPGVVPPTCGVRLEGKDVVRPVQALLADEARLAALGRGARAHAEAHLHKRSAEEPMREMLERFAALQPKTEGA